MTILIMKHLIMMLVIYSTYIFILGVFRIICLLVSLFCVQSYRKYHLHKESILNRLKCDEYSKQLQAAGLISSALLFTHFFPKCAETVTYKKSSDTEWEISPKRMPDTTIIDTLVISGQIATPTVQYINIKIK